jgi:hypothetical protein
LLRAFALVSAVGGGGHAQQEASTRCGFRAAGADSIPSTRIQLTNCQANELLTLTRPSRQCNPIRDEDAAIAKEIFEAVELTNAVEWALKFYVRDVVFRIDVPQYRRRLKTLRNDVDRFLTTLPQEDDLVGYFLKRTYTREVFLADHLRPTDEQSERLEETWLAKHGFTAIRNSLAELQRNIDSATSLLSGTRPRNVAVAHFVGLLADAWKAATGQSPRSGRDDYKNSHQSGPFANFVHAVNAMLPSEYQIANLDHAIRSTCARNKPYRSKAKPA